MGRYRLTKAADRGFESIFDFGIDRFGMDRAQAYQRGMIEHLAQLAERPLLYSSVGHLRLGLHPRLVMMMVFPGATSSRSAERRVFASNAPTFFISLSNLSVLHTNQSTSSVMSRFCGPRAVWLAAQQRRTVLTSTHGQTYAPMHEYDTKTRSRCRRLGSAGAAGTWTKFQCDSQRGPAPRAAYDRDTIQPVVHLQDAYGKPRPLPDRQPRSRRRGACNR